MGSKKEIFESNLSHFRIKSRGETKAQCICPAHDDKEASLTISIGKTKTVFCCHAGCTFDAILSAAGLKASETYYSDQPQEISKKQWWLEHNATRYDFFRLDDCSYDMTKWRTPEKKFEWGQYSNGIYTMSRQDAPIRKHPLSVFCNGKPQALKKAIEQGQLVAYTEGEKDAQTLDKNGFIAFTFGGVNTFTPEALPSLAGGNFLVFADNDQPGISDADKIVEMLRTVANAQKIVPSNIEKGDVSDYLQTHSREELQALIDTVISPQKPPETVKQIVAVDDINSLLITATDGRGSIKAVQCVRNWEIILDNDPRFSGKVRYNEFSRRLFLFGNVPWSGANNVREWSDLDDAALFSIVQVEYGLKQRNDERDAVNIVGNRNRFHPVKDLLDALEWDGREHIRHLLPDYLGAESSDYNAAVWRVFMVAGVARIYQPGAKMDYCPILSGRQGLGKSSLLEFIAIDSEWYTDSIGSFDGKDSVSGLIGAWIVEIGELKAFARTMGGILSAKKFISAKQDKVRLPYEKRDQFLPRTCVFCGTTNQHEYLVDSTGNRRFLPIECGVSEPKKNLFSPEALEDIKQAWAEATYIWKTEHPELVLPPEFVKQAEEAQKAAMEDDGTEGLIVAYLQDKTRVCILEIWQEALGEVGRPKKYQSGEISDIILQQPGWQRMKSPGRFGTYGMQRGFERNNCLHSPEQMSTIVAEKPSEEQFTKIDINEEVPFEVDDD